MISALLIGMLVLLLSGTSIYVALGLSSFVALQFFSDVQPMILIQKFFGGIDKFALMSLPFFILSANLMDKGGLSTRILQLSKALVGHISGGVALTTQVACMFFWSFIRICSCNSSCHRKDYVSCNDFFWI